MTGDVLLDFLISVAGIALIVAVSAAFGAVRSVAVTEAAAADRLAFDEPDFVPQAWLVSADAKAAVAEAADEIALVFALGDGLASRRLKRGAAKVERAGKALVFRLGDVAKPRVTILAADEKAAAGWLSRLAGAAL